ncbi:serine hydrolase [Methanoregula formicica]|uniref:Penicillin-binding protein, beta-lactamase class C n=1 Tax=Methanoregula formicica (strain DSM 22288 / NBRC 105244 / SMSP) TaxID=593750 RepID=L0HEY3_METFS|nr:serine hydrolase [Methanoregula formicica]AGB02580.1 penicillin-binding protein, beta-lactamase class C [Methanoregula formicica SMSP]
MQVSRHYVLIVLVCAAVLAAGCTQQASVQPQAPTTAGTPAKTSATADTATLVPQFDAYAEKTFSQSGVVGMAVAIVRDDKVIYLRTFGVKNVTTNEPVGPDTRFQLASISKSVTGTMIAEMVGNGELSWDDTIVSVNPAFRLSDPYVTQHVTFRDLLSHRSGLPEYGADDLQNDLKYSRQEIMDRLPYLGLGGFRSSYAYSNIGITIAGVTAAMKAGKPYEDLVAERIFIPAGMYNTSARFSDFTASPDRVELYPMHEGTPVAGPPVDDDINSPAGGVSSTINDMVRYARFQANGGSLDGKQVVNASALKESHTPQFIRSYSGTGMMGSGMGWNTFLDGGRSRIEKDGMFSQGTATIITVWPEEKMALVVLTNKFPEGNVVAGSLSNAWNDLYYNGRIGKDWYAVAQQELQAWFDTHFPEPVQKPVNPQPPRDLKYYTGSYTQDYYGTARVVEESGKLQVYPPGHSTTPFALLPYDGDTFSEEISGILVKFSAGTSAHATGVWFTRYEAPGRSGAFTRASA